METYKKEVANISSTSCGITGILHINKGARYYGVSSLDNNKHIQ